MYNTACAHSLLEDGKQALAWLSRAIEAYPEYRSIAPDDPNLDFLRREPAFLPEYRSLIGD
jgi:hypothetical protein